MLTLIKNDLINTKKKYLISFIVLAALSILMPLTFLGIDITNDGGAQNTSVILSLLLSLAIFAFFTVGIILLSTATKQFNKSMFSSQGYLSFTLPYKTWQVVLSKIITFIIWALSFILVYFICINIALVELNFILIARSGTSFPFSDFYNAIWTEIKYLAVGRFYFVIIGAIDGSISNINTLALVFSLIKLVLYIPLYICLVLLTSSICGSSVSHKIKSWMHALIFIAIAYALFFFNNVVTFLIAKYIESQILPYLYDLLAVISIIVGSFAISTNLLENKLEL